VADRAAGATFVDLRSDTVTKPGAGMRAEMAAAEVGDDVYGEDPTVNALEARVAGLFGHEAALFTPTGSMANQIAVQLLVPPGDELLCDADAHVVTYEVGAAAAYGGISTRTWPAHGGDVDPDDVVAMIRPDGFHAVPTRAIAVEQTHNRAGGAVLPLSTLAALRAAADTAGIGLHCDGARIWHAHVADSVPLTGYGRLFDTLSVCLSKGLGAPAGSLVVSSAAKIATARVIRKRLGGGMRQAGVLAAAGLHALEHHVERLPDDHANARAIGERLAACAGVAVDLDRLETNIVIARLGEGAPDAATVVARARERGVLVMAFAPRTIRAVTHLDVTAADCATAADVLAQAVAA
jgi:threonine aldolase